MLTEPIEFRDTIITMLLKEYDIEVEQMKFLPLGADQNTIVYKATTSKEENYFVKIRKDSFANASIQIPELLSKGGAKHIIPIITTKSGQSWCTSDRLTCIVYPFIFGNNAEESKLSVEKMTELGSLLKKMHTLKLPSSVESLLTTESFNTNWHVKIIDYITTISTSVYTDSSSLQLQRFVSANSERLNEIIREVEVLSKIVIKSREPFVVCHADFHAYNLLVTDDDDFYLIDFDTIVLAPKERDLMFIGGKIDTLSDNAQIVNAFYDGYGKEPINMDLIKYYRLNRILEDLVVDFELILSANTSPQDKEQNLKYFINNFLPGNTIDAAFGN